MKNFILSFLVSLFFVSPVYAIKWDTLHTPLGNTVFLDVDSITEYNNYYFYNIKFKNQYGKNYMVLTMQSAIAHPFSARLRLYSEQEYENLNGDYDKITDKMTSKLEPVTFESTVNTCYKRVKLIMQHRNSDKIKIN